MDQITITLPLTERGLWVILSAIGLAAATGLVWLTLSEQDRKTSRTPLSWLIAFGWVLLPLWLAIFCATLWQVWGLLTGAGSILTGPGSLGAGALIAALLGAPFVIWGTVLRQRTVDFQKEGHITDRINKAVEQLGAEKTVKKLVDGQSQETTEPNIEVRIGAILSLERIAQDSTRYDKGRDHVRVMEILCAYVRGNSNAIPPQDYPEPDWEPLKDDATEEERRTHLEKRQERFGSILLYSRAWTWAQNLPAPRADIAQALQVLGRRTADQRRAEAAWPDPPSKDTIWPFDTPCPSLAKTPNEAKRDPQAIEEFKKKLNVWRLAMDRCSGYRLDLRGANLQNADLSAGRPDASDAVFSGAKLSGARMEGASLEGTRMEGTDLKRVTMQGAVAIKARMQGANLFHVEMEGADLTVAVMNNAILVMARIDGADVSGAELIGARCSAVRMEGSDFKWAHMQGTNFERARLEGADLNMALMDEANLSRARLQGASLSTSQLKGTNLKRIRMDEDTFIKDATFQGACLQYADEATARKLAQHCEQIFADGTVTLLNGIGRPAHWPDWELPNTGPHAFDTEWRKWQANPAAYTPPPKPD